MKPILYESTATNFFNLGLGVLSGCKDVKVTEGANAEFYLELKYPIDGPQLSELKNNRIIKTDAGHELKGQQFEIKRISKPIKGFVTVYAEHVSYKAKDIPLRPNVTITGDGQTALRQWQGSFIGDYKPFTVSSNVTSSHTTSWSIREVENARQALGGVEGSILDTWGGEFKFDNYHITLFRERGKRANAMIAYGRNLVDFEQEESILNTYTSIYPYAIWADDDGKDHLITADGFIVDSEHVNKYPNKKVLPVDFTVEFEREEKPTSAKLTQLAKDYIKNNDIGVPDVSIRLTHLDLSKTLNHTEYQGIEEINLFDRAMVKFLKIGVDVTAKVVRIVWNVLLERYDEIEIGSIRASLSDRLNAISQTVSDAKKEANEARTIAVVSANGINMTFFGPNEPTATKVGDTWYQEDGTHTILKMWDGVIWRRIFGTDDKEFLEEEIKENNKLVEEAKEAAADAKTLGETAAIKADTASQEAVKAVLQADTVASVVNQAVVAAGFTKLTDLTADMRMKTAQAQSNATSAINRAAELTGELSGVKGSVSAIDVRINSISGTLDLKANTAEINRIDGTLSSIDTQLSVQAGQLSSKISETQLKGAIDGIKIGDRNYLLDSKQRVLSSSTTQYRFLIYKLSETLTEDQVMTINGKVEVTNGSFTKVTLLFRAANGVTTTSSLRDIVNGNVSWTATIPKGTLEVFIYAGAAGATAGNSGIYTNFYLKKSSKLSDWSPAPEDFDARVTSVQSEFNQTFDNFESTVADLQGDVTKQSQTLTTISSSITNAEGRITQTEANINGIQSTVSGPNGLSTRVTQLSNQYSVLASDFKKIEVGDRNLLRDSKPNIITSNYPTVYLPISEPLQTGEEVTVVLKGELTSEYWGIYNTNGSTGFLVSLRDNQLISPGLWRVTFKWKNISNNNRLAIYAIPNRSVNNKIEWVKLVRGNKTSNDWSSAPEDMATQAEFSVLSTQITQRVTKADLIGEINTRAGRILIRANDNVLMVTPETTFIANATIKEGHIENLAVTNAKIANGSINSAKMGTAAIQNAHIGDGVITNAKIGNGAINDAKIQNAAISSAKIINLDLNKVVGFSSSFIQSYWNGISDWMKADAGGLTSSHSSGRQIVYSSGAIQFRNSAGERYQLDADPGFKGLNFYPMNNDYNPNGLAISGKGTNMISLGRDEGDDGYEWRFEQTHAGELKLQSKHSLLFRMLLGASSQVNDWRFYNALDSTWGSLNFGNVRLSLNTVPRTGGGGSLSAEMTDGRHIAMRASAFAVNSERRLKTNIQPLDNASEMLCKLKVYSYDKQGKFEYGFIADEMPKNLLGYENTTVSLYDVSALTVKSVQEINKKQEEEHRALKADVISLDMYVKGKVDPRISKLEIENEQLKLRIKQLEDKAA